MFSRETVIREFGGKKVEQEVIFGNGRLVNDPPAVQLVGQDNKKVLRGSKEHGFSIALDRGKDNTEFFNLTAWGTTADNLAKLGYKGQPIIMIGHIEKSEYQGKTYESLVVENFTVLKYKDNGSNGATTNGATTPPNTTAPSENSQTAPTGATEVNNEANGTDDDIPF